MGKIVDRGLIVDLHIHSDLSKHKDQTLVNDNKIENIKVISTGGFGRMISEATDIIDIYNPDLSLEGLKIIYNKNRR